MRNTTYKTALFIFRALFVKGEDLTNKAVGRYIEKLHRDNLPAPSFPDHLITTSTFSPFSDKLMMFHKMDMFSMKNEGFWKFSSRQWKT